MGAVPRRLVLRPHRAAPAGSLGRRRRRSSAYGLAAVAIRDRGLGRDAAHGGAVHRAFAPATYMLTTAPAWGVVVDIGREALRSRGRDDGVTADSDRRDRQPGGRGRNPDVVQRLEFPAHLLGRLFVIGAACRLSSTPGGRCSGDEEPTRAGVRAQARRATRRRLPVAFLSACSQMRRTRQPRARSSRLTRRSRVVAGDLAPEFRVLPGLRAVSRARSSRRRRPRFQPGKNKKSGRPGRPEPRRQPVMPYARKKNAMSRSSVALLPRPRMSAMRAGALSAWRKSGMAAGGGDFSETTLAAFTAQCGGVPETGSRELWFFGERDEFLVGGALGNMLAFIRHQLAVERVGCDAGSSSKSSSHRGEKVG